MPKVRYFSYFLPKSIKKLLEEEEKQERENIKKEEKVEITLPSEQDKKLAMENPFKEAEEDYDNTLKGKTFSNNKKEDWNNYGILGQYAKNEKQNSFNIKLDVSKFKNLFTTGFLKNNEYLKPYFANEKYVSIPEKTLLELILNFVLDKDKARETSNKLIQQIGCLCSILDSSYNDLKILGIDEKAISLINLLGDMTEIKKETFLNLHKKLRDASGIIEYLKLCTKECPYEKFYYICLNSKGEVICFKPCGTGNSKTLSLNVREIVEDMLKYSSHSVIICHSHPQGLPYPSIEDIEFTHKLFIILEDLDIRLIDHIIFSPKGTVSFFQSRVLGNAKDSKEYNNFKLGILPDDFVFHY